MGRNIDVPTFIAHVQPLLTTAGYAVTDMQTFKHDHGRRVFASIRDADSPRPIESLVNTASAALSAAGYLARLQEKLPSYERVDMPSHYAFTDYGTRVDFEGEGLGSTKWTNVYPGVIEPVGLYDDNATASEQFALLAHQFLSDDVKKGVVNLNKIIKDLLGKNLAQFAR